MLVSLKLFKFVVVFAMGLDWEISLLVFIVIVSMTFGYARFSKLVNVSGTLVVQGNGAIFISNVTKGTHNHATSNPVIS